MRIKSSADDENTPLSPKPDKGRDGISERWILIAILNSVLAIGEKLTGETMTAIVENNDGHEYQITRGRAFFEPASSPGELHSIAQKAKEQNKQTQQDGMLHASDT